MNTATRSSSGTPVAIATMVATLGPVGCTGDESDTTPIPRDSPAAKISDETPPRSAGWLTEITAARGLDLTHDAGATGDLLLPEIMGPGLALFDADGDGDLDLYLPNGNRLLPGQGRGDDPLNRLYRQDDDGRFVDATAASGLGDGWYGMGAAVGDVDNDGDLDLFVTNFGSDRLYLNRGDGVFDDVTETAGIDVPGWSCSAAFLDFDRDGRLDLYVTQYVDFDASRTCHDLSGRRDYCGPLSFTALPDVLLRNTSTGAVVAFEDVSDDAGISAVAAAGLGVTIDDFNDDGWIDVYVANDAYANNLWINQQDGTLRDLAIVSGVGCNLHGQAEAGMGVVSADLDDNELPDLFVTNLNQESNTFYRQHPGGVFVDGTGASGLAASSMDLTGFGVAAIDLEHDGDLDLLIANGRVVRGRPLPGTSMRPPWDEFAEPNLAYLNDGTGRFTIATAVLADLCDPIEITRGLVSGDIDGDGDLDIIITNTEASPRVYRNDAPKEGSWLIVEAVDAELNRAAIGGVVRVIAGERVYRAVVNPASGYLTAGDVRLHFGLGRRDAIDRIEVRWPDGLDERFDGGPVNRVVRLVHGTGVRGP